MNGAAPERAKEDVAETAGPPAVQSGPPPPRDSPPATVLKLDLPPRKKGVLRLVAKAMLFCAIAGCTALLLAALALYAYFSQDLPSIPTTASYRPPVLSEFWSQDGALAGEFYLERRKVASFDRIPKILVQAFIAAEDKNFFDHYGVDPVGTFRAVYNNLRGGRTQGGSTLTQQTAKAVLVSAELRRLDPDEIMTEAERSVPKVGEPAPEVLKPEAAAVRKEKKERLLARFAGRKMNEWELAQATKVSEEEVREEARNRLLRRAEAERSDRVKAAFIRIREEREHAAVKAATAKKITRKIREAILARRLEKSLSKEEILYLYLNNVNFGHKAYGVQSAAENYFRKDVGELTLGEIGLIAGLSQSPSRNPWAQPEAAKKRRVYVLKRMVEEGMITPEAKAAAEAEPVVTYPVEDVFRDTAPFFTEQVRRDIVSRYGNSRLYKDGLRVSITMDAEAQRAAQVAMLRGLIHVDKRQGYLGPLSRQPSTVERMRFNERIAKILAPDEPRAGEWYVGTVERLDGEGNFAEVQVGASRLKLPIMGARWARKPDPERYYPQALVDHVSQALRVGDVILVKAVKKLEYDDVQAGSANAPKLVKQIPDDPLLLQLEQSPTLQGALVSIDPWRNYVLAMIGGYDFDASEFNRAFQACRQPGSAFKPVVYSAAIEKLPDYTPVKPIVDSPVVFDDEENQVRWKPENFGEDFKGDVLLRDAVINSMNVPAVKTLHAVGIKDLIGWAKKLGLSRPIAEDLSVALGSSCVIPWELTQVYAIFNQGGRRVSPTFVRKIEDRFGRILEDNSAYDDAWATMEERVAGGYAKLFDNREQVMTPETASVMLHLMREVVQFGTGVNAQRINRPAAGKTGTTNDSFDAWFLGFSHDIVTGSWVGYDRYEHPLARYETGGRAALPIWVDYMKHAIGSRPQPEFSPAPGADIVVVKIDPRNGKLAAAGDKDGVPEWFKRGTEPKEESGKPTLDSDFLLRDTQ